MLTKKCGFLLLVLMPCIVRAQTAQGIPYVDSLLLRLPDMEEDTAKVVLLDNLAFAYSNINPDEGLKYAFQAVALSEQLKWKRGIAVANAGIGVNYTAKSEHLRALEYELKALALYKELGDKRGEAAMLANLSLIYSAQSDYPKALEYAFEALKMNEELGNKARCAIVLENIGTLFFEQKNYPKTTEYYTSASNAYLELDDRAGLARNAGNMGIVLDAQGNHNLALEHHQMALKTNQELGDKHSIQVNLANIGYVHSHMKNYSRALHYQFRALRLSEELGSKNSIAINLGNIGETYYAIAQENNSIHPDSLVAAGSTANLQKAEEYLEKAVGLCKEINFSAPLVEFSKYLSDTYAQLGDFKQALESFKLHTAMNDSVFSQQNKMELARLETKRELDLKDRDIIIKNKEVQIALLQAANKRNERILYITGIVLLMVVMGAVVRKFLKSSQAHKRVLKDIAHIQSHDVRAPVAKILGLAQLFNQDDLTDPVNKQVIEAMHSSTLELDEMVRKVVNKATS